MPVPLRKSLTAAALGLGSVASLAYALLAPNTPAHALTVFDPSNYSQNLLTAARTLTQINNQIQSLQNEAQMLIGQAKNLSRIDFPQLQQLTRTLQAIDRLMGQAEGIDFRIDGLDQQFSRLFPDDFNQALATNQRVIDATTRLEAAKSGYRQTMGVQSQVVANVQADATILGEIIARSQGADGALQVNQATNQLLALSAKQQFQIQELMAAQYRAEAMEAARRAQAEAEGRAATKSFLGTGTAYGPPPPGQ